MKKFLFGLAVIFNSMSFAGDINLEWYHVATISTASPFITTSETLADLMEKTIYEEAEDIISDGDVTEQELEEISIELEVELDRCRSRSQSDIDENRIIEKCLKSLAAFAE